MFTFLDFSTLAERERTARREMALNAPNAPGLYHDVVAVTRTANGVELNGAGEVVDWVVRMARVPEQDFLPAIAASGGLSPALLDGMADAVATLHAQALPAVTEHEAALRRTLLGNHASGLAAGIPAAMADRWRDAALAELSRHAAWLADRVARGFVRRTHGDLHLGNFCLWQGRPVAFDALEFSEAMATIDLGYDLAFLLMDLEIHAGRPAANRVLNRYVARTGDTALVAGLPLFLSMRAMVRAHVTARGGGDWQRYFSFAEAALQPAPCVMVAIGGLPGTGKSTMARALAPRLGRAPGALVLRSDETRKRRAGVMPEQRLPKSAYAEPESRAVMTELLTLAATAVGAGHTVIADATFMAPSDRDAAARTAGSVAFVGVWLEAPLPVLEARIEARRGDASDADVAVLRRAAQADPGAGAWLALDSTDPAAPDALTRHITALTQTC